jgi:glycerol-3-phosphate acyltransferase PlsY
VITNYLLMIILVFVSGFVIGSLPISYWYIKSFKGIDLRYVGTRSLGSSNMINFVGKKPVYFVALFDFGFKGTMPLLILRYLEYEPWVQVFAGLLIVCGHNWSPFVGYKGGRGILTSLGVILGLGMWIEFTMMCILAGFIGRGLIYKDSAFWTFIGFGLFIGLVLIFNDKSYFIVFSNLLVACLLFKRLIGNMEPMRGRSKLKIILYRLIFDRDIRSRNDWIRRDLQNLTSL